MNFNTCQSCWEKFPNGVLMHLYKHYRTRENFYICQDCNKKRPRCKTCSHVGDDHYDGHGGCSVEICPCEGFKK